jgi:AraC-like DNA-binding protein
MRIRGSQDGFSMRHTNVDAGPFSVATLSHTMAVEHDNDPLAFLLVGQVLRGRMEREAVDGTMQLSPGEVFLLFTSPNRPVPFTVRWDAVTMRLTRIDLAVLAELGAAVGRETPRFAGLRPSAPGQARHLTATQDWLINELLPSPDALAQPLITGRVARMLAATVLASFPTTTTGGPHPAERRDATPAVLHRALAYIENHAHLDITLADLAGATRVSTRTVQHTFRRHLDTTPTAYLRRVRLDRAHRDLRAADPTRGDTVTAIAHRWGFLNTGRFTTTYRSAYGHPPRHTLHT